MKFTVALRLLFLTLDVHIDDGSGDTAYEPDPQGSTCGVVERAAAWDHDNRPPVGFAGNIHPMPNPYDKPKES